MKYLAFVRHPESIRQSPPPHGFMEVMGQSKEVIGGWAILQGNSNADVMRVATEFMELHRKHWPGFEGEAEVRPMFDPGMGP